MARRVNWQSLDGRELTHGKRRLVFRCAPGRFVLADARRRVIVCTLTPTLAGLAGAIDGEPVRLTEEGAIVSEKRAGGFGPARTAW